MSIKFIPNDPRASGGPATGTITPSPARPASRADFTYVAALPAQAVYAPGTDGFLAWQSREAALRAVAAWEAINGPLAKWATGARKLQLRRDAGDDLNAYYDRSSLSFFHSDTGVRVARSGESTDVVAHEAGHAFLDALRPDFWDSTYFEVNSLHEATGDCVAILTALADPAQRAKVKTKLGKKNFIESTAEDLSRAIGEVMPTHNAAKPRQAFNTFQWALPDTLPADGGPGALISEIHSFAQIFSGCFYDVLRGLFAAGSGAAGARLETAVATAGRLLVEGLHTAPEDPRMFRSVGQSMVLADQHLFGGVNGLVIRNAFARHGIVLGSSALVAPAFALAGKVKGAAAAPKLDAHAQADILGRLGAKRGARLAIRAMNLGSTAVSATVHTRAVDLSSIDKRLKGVVAHAAESVVVGRHGIGAAVFGAMPDVQRTEEETLSFVTDLMNRGRIEMAPTRGAVKATRRTTAHRLSGRPTHAVVGEAGGKVLRRLRYVCGG